MLRPVRVYGVMSNVQCHRFKRRGMHGMAASQCEKYVWHLAIQARVYFWTTLGWATYHKFIIYHLILLKQLTIPVQYCVRCNWNEFENGIMLSWHTVSVKFTTSEMCCHFKSIYNRRIRKAGVVVNKESPRFGPIDILIGRIGFRTR